MKQWNKAIIAGILIGIGCVVYLAADSKLEGSVFFCVALLTICMQNLNLFTGKAGYVSNHKDLIQSGIILIGNFVGALIVGVYCRIVRQDLVEKAQLLVAAKLQNFPWFTRAAWSGFFCGVIMFFAVNIWREHHLPWGILFGIPTFILCGFEHSIADMVYMMAGATAENWWKCIIFLIIVIIYNFFGAQVARRLSDATV